MIFSCQTLRRDGEGWPHCWGIYLPPALSRSGPAAHKIRPSNSLLERLTSYLSRRLNLRFKSPKSLLPSSVRKFIFVRRNISNGGKNPPPILRMIDFIISSSWIRNNSCPFGSVTIHFLCKIPAQNFLVKVQICAPLLESNKSKVPQAVEE